ncbi:hypothetical protein ACF07D_04685 [Leucobacter sp. NPDC015123]|uniref:hypothetical protein n=1 Tax=Leucobacter sp. NPDC015123 TaxID=3364129 RepID=UPI0036F45DA0
MRFFDGQLVPEADVSQPFLDTPTPLWVTLASILISVASVFIAWLATRNSGILSAPDIHIEVTRDYDNSGTSVPMRVTNKGKSTARDLSITWNFDPTWALNSESAWSTEQLRPGEFIDTWLVPPRVPPETDMLWEHYIPLLDNAEHPEQAFGVLRYKKQLAFFRYSRERLRLPRQFPAE